MLAGSARQTGAGGPGGGGTGPESCRAVVEGVSLSVATSVCFCFFRGIPATKIASHLQSAAPVHAKRGPQPRARQHPVPLDSYQMPICCVFCLGRELFGLCYMQTWASRMPSILFMYLEQGHTKASSFLVQHARVFAYAFRRR